MLFFEEKYSQNKNDKILLFSVTVSISNHVSFLERHCRVCCMVLGKQKYLCSHHESLLKSVGVNLSRNPSTVFL